METRLAWNLGSSASSFGAKMTVPSCPAYLLLSKLKFYHLFVIHVIYLLICMYKYICVCVRYVWYVHVAWVCTGMYDLCV